MAVSVKTTDDRPVVRSIDNLQRLYTVVISLAVTELIKNVLPTITKPGNYAEWLTTIALLFTVVRFYHGANRYLDATYVTGERSASSKHSLLLDFVVLFVEGLLIYSLSFFWNRESLFYTILALLLLVDCAWILITGLHTDDKSDPASLYKKWGLLNLVVALLLIVPVYSLKLAPTVLPMYKSVFFCALAVVRTVIDYWGSWRFYYPYYESGTDDLSNGVKKDATSGTPPE